MFVIRKLTLSEITPYLTRYQARLTPPEVQALFLGAVVANRRPIDVLDEVFGDNESIRGTGMLLLSVLLRFSNFLSTERGAGRIAFAAVDEVGATREELHAHAQRRLGELKWFNHGIGVGGTEPLGIGPEGERMLAMLNEVGASLRAYSSFLEAEATTLFERLQLRAALMEIDASIAARLKLLTAACEEFQRPESAALEERLRRAFLQRPSMLQCPSM